MVRVESHRVGPDPLPLVISGWEWKGSERILPDEKNTEEYRGSPGENINKPAVLKEV